MRSTMVAASWVPLSGWARSCRPRSPLATGSKAASGSTAGSTRRARPPGSGGTAAVTTLASTGRSDGQPPSLWYTTMSSGSAASGRRRRRVARSPDEAGQVGARSPVARTRPGSVRGRRRPRSARSAGPAAVDGRRGRRRWRSPGLWWPRSPRWPVCRSAVTARTSVDGRVPGATASGLLSTAMSVTCTSLGLESPAHGLDRPCAICSSVIGGYAVAPGRGPTHDRCIARGDMTDDSNEPSDEPRRADVPRPRGLRSPAEGRGGDLGAHGHIGHHRRGGGQGRDLVPGRGAVGEKAWKGITIYPPTRGVRSPRATRSNRSRSGSSIDMDLGQLLADWIDPTILAIEDAPERGRVQPGPDPAGDRRRPGPARGRTTARSRGLPLAGRAGVRRRARPDDLRQLARAQDLANELKVACVELDRRPQVRRRSTASPWPTATSPPRA